MKKVLILCDLFPPAFAPRMGYLCKYLAQMGWQPVVVAEHVEEQMFGFLTGYADAREINYYQAKSKWGKRFERFFVLTADFLFNYKSRKITRTALQLCREHSFELVLCSSFRDFPLKAAHDVARKIKRPLLVDLRDIIEQYVGNEFIPRTLPSLFGLERLIISAFRKRSLAIRNRVLKAADAVTTVSPWHVETLKAFNPNVFLIYNGYDPELFYPETVQTEQFFLTYTGRILSVAMRDPKLLFEAIAKLSADNTITPQDFQLRWYIDNKSRAIIERESQHYDIREYMDFYGYIPADKIPGVLNESSMLLLLANKSTGNGPKGIMTTKLFESMAVEKPILCVPGDEGCLEETIREAKSGLSAHSTKEVVQFITHYFKEWKAKGSTHIDVDRAVVQRYSRKAQAQQFIQLFEQLSGK